MRPERASPRTMARKSPLSVTRRSVSPESVDAQCCHTGPDADRIKVPINGSRSVVQCVPGGDVMPRRRSAPPLHEVFDFIEYGPSFLRRRHKVQRQPVHGGLRAPRSHSTSRRQRQHQPGEGCGPETKLEPLSDPLMAYRRCGRCQRVVALPALREAPCPRCHAPRQ